MSAFAPLRQALLGVRMLQFQRDLAALAEVAAAATQREEGRMAVPQMRGFAAHMRDLRAAARGAMAALEQEATLAHGAFHDALGNVKTELTEVRAATAELTGDLAETGNGGPPLDRSPGESASLPRGFSEVHPSLRQPPST